MAAAMRVLFAGPAVIVDVDIPDLDVSHVMHAFAALEQHDAVLRPAEDGGYWLMGLRRRRPLPHLFDGVRWSSKHALAGTLANLRLGRSHALIDTLTDIDDAASLKRLRECSARLPIRTLS